MKHRFLPFIVRGTDDPGGGLPDINELEPGSDPNPDPTPDPDPDPQFDLRTKEQEERDKAIYLRGQADLLERQQQAAALEQARQQTKSEEDRELEAIAELRIQGEYIEAERRANLLARSQARADIESQYGGQLSSAGVSEAISHINVIFPDAPTEVKPYLEQAVRELNLQGQIPKQFVSAVEELGYGKAFKAGAIGKAPVKKTVAATGAESTTFTNASVPSDVAADATEFEKHFGSAAKDKALKEAGY